MSQKRKATPIGTESDRAVHGDDLPDARQIVDRIARAREEYATMVEVLKTGERVPLDRIYATLRAARKTADDLVADVLAGEGRPVRPGDSCEQCGGPLVVYCTKRRKEGAVQYLKCGGCGHRPASNKRPIPEARIRRWRSRANE